MPTAFRNPPRFVQHDSRRTKRLLLVAYCFPPVGGAGVQRPVKWVKYLHRAGWQVTVLTPENPSVPVLDDSLLAEVPPETAFIRAKTWEPAYHHKQAAAAGDSAAASCLGMPWRWCRGMLRSAARMALQPDPQILWLHNAVEAASQHLRVAPHDAILATAPPFSSFLIGTELRRRFRLPLILDYRDEWDLSNQYLENAPRDWFSQFVQEHMQRFVLKRADAVLATTNASLRRLQQRLNSLKRPAYSTCIYNGYDAEDFTDCPGRSTVPDAAPGTFRLVYSGTLWRLTDASPLIAALERLHQLAPDLARKVELVCVGRKTPEQQAVLKRLEGTTCRLINVDYTDHAVILDWLRTADALCLLLADVPGAERVVPAKLFEYLATRKPLLAIVPHGECADIVRSFHPEGRVTPDDVVGIVNWLQSRLRTLSPPRMYNTADIEDYSREHQAGRLIRLLGELRPASRTIAAGG